MKIMEYKHSNHGFITSRYTFYVDKFGEFKYFNSLDEKVLRGMITYNRLNYYYNGALIACLVNIYDTVKPSD